MLEERVPIIRTMCPLLFFEPDMSIATSIRSMLKQSNFRQSDIVSCYSLEDTARYVNQDDNIYTILFTIKNFLDKEFTRLTNLVERFPEENIIVIAKDGYIEQGLKVIELGAKDCLFEADLTAEKLIRAIRFAEQRSKVQRVSTQKILKSQERYQDIIDNSKDAIYVCDLEGHLVDFNQSTSILIGYDIKELPRVDIHNLMRSIKRRNEFLVRLVATKKVENFEIEIERKNGERRQCLVTARMMEYADFIGYTSVIRDITEKKQAEALKKARDLARRSAEMKEAFIASVSHEMRTPMNAILGMSNLVLQTPLNGEQLNYISSIKHSSEILLGVVNDILEISEIKNGKVKFENKNFDLHALLINLINVMQYKVKEKNLLLELIMDEYTPMIIRGDKLRLNQILYNLVGNAIKFTETGHVKIYVVNLSQNDFSVQIKFIVEDTGIGIPDKKLEAIFDSFTRIRTRDKIYEGTGLGLSIAKNLIEQQGGKIGVTSKVNEGSSFFFDLIFEIGDELEIEYTPKEKSIIAEGQSFKLLLVEDHKMNQIVAKKTLEKQWRNIQITIANNGQEAIDILASEQEFDVVLMDIQMPKMDGYEATQYIRQKMAPEIAQLPILAMTAHAHISKDEKFREYGMDDYVLKPFEPEQLFEKISRYVLAS